jgi:hypothetical protein
MEKKAERIWTRIPEELKQTLTTISKKVRLKESDVVRFLLERGVTAYLNDGELVEGQDSKFLVGFKVDQMQHAYLTVIARIERRTVSEIVKMIFERGLTEFLEDWTLYEPGRTMTLERWTDPKELKAVLQMEDIPDELFDQCLDLEAEGKFDEAAALIAEYRSRGPKKRKAG